MARYGKGGILCSSKQRAKTMAKLMRANGYGASVVENYGKDKREYPYLVRKTNRPTKKPKK